MIPSFVATLYNVFWTGDIAFSMLPNSLTSSSVLASGVVILPRGLSQSLNTLTKWDPPFFLRSVICSKRVKCVSILGNYLVNPFLVDWSWWSVLAFQVRIVFGFLRGCLLNKIYRGWLSYSWLFAFKNLQASKLESSVNEVSVPTDQ